MNKSGIRYATAAVVLGAGSIGWGVAVQKKTLPPLKDKLQAIKDSSECQFVEGVNQRCQLPNATMTEASVCRSNGKYLRCADEPVCEELTTDTYQEKASICYDTQSNIEYDIKKQVLGPMMLGTFSFVTGLMAGYEACMYN